jgi:hypothetical protein
VREAGGHVAFTALRRPARRAAGPRAALPGVAARTRAGPARARRVPRSTGLTVLAPLGPCHHGWVIDWTLAAQVAAASRASSPPAIPRRSRRSTAPPRRASGSSPPTPASCRRAAARRRGRRPRRVDRGQPRLARGVLEPVADRLGGGSARWRRRRPAWALLAAEAGAISGFLAGRVLGQYEFPMLDPTRPRGCCSSRPTSATPPRARRRARPAAALGRAARDHARAAVRRRAVAARAPRGMRARAARRHDLRGRQPAAGSPTSPTSRARGPRARGRHRDARARPERRELFDRMQA